MWVLPSFRTLMNKVQYNTDYILKGVICTLTITVYTESLIHINNITIHVFQFFP